MKTMKGPISSALLRGCLRSFVTCASSLVFVVGFWLSLTREGRRLEEVRHGEAEDHWPWQTWSVAVLVALICGGGQLCCCLHCIRAGFQRGDFQATSLGQFYAPLKQDELALHAFKPDHEKIGHILRREMRFMLLFPIIPLLAIHWTSCRKGMPWWGYLLYLPLLLRAKWIEAQILLALNEDLKSIFLSPGFWLGMLEHADWFTDGALPVQAYLCDLEIPVTEHFAFSFEMSWAWPLAPIVRTLHFWGLLSLVLSFSALAQQLLGAVDSGEKRLDLAADVPGFGAVANWYEEQDHDWNKAAEDGGCLSERALLTSISKVFLENVVQLWLQASFFGLIFDRLHHVGKVKLLISMALGLISCLAKILPMAVGLLCALRAGSIGWAQGMAILLGQMIAICCIAWTAMKLYKSFHCETHIWNLTTGCVPKEIIEGIS